MNQRREARMRADFTAYVRLEIAITRATMTDYRFRPSSRSSHHTAIRQGHRKYMVPPIPCTINSTK